MRFAYYFVIPAKAGIQAVLRQSARANTRLTKPSNLDVLPKQLAASLRAAWVPAFAGMTK